ncbi:hypothetical protein GQ457_01G036600 [Hibiscus cannabinus]
MLTQKWPKTKLVKPKTKLQKKASKWWTGGPIRELRDLKQNQGAGVLFLSRVSTWLLAQSSLTYAFLQKRHGPGQNDPLCFEVIFRPRRPKTMTRLNYWKELFMFLWKGICHCQHLVTIHFPKLGTGRRCKFQF